MHLQNYNFKKLFIILFTLLLLFFPFINYSFANEDVQISAPSVILMDYASGKILYEKNANQRMYPASTTKLMTAILTLENCELSDIATVSYNAIMTVPSGYTNANLHVDEELTIEQLLHILLIPSANDAANVLAEHIAGSVESFSTMMNTKALELGCKDTHFVNPSGIHDENHYSTAYDLALIGKYAMKFDIIKEIVTKETYTLPITNKHDKTDRIFATTNRLVLNKSKNTDYYEYATGLKTGYTLASKNCIVASAKKDNMELICVILGCEKGTANHAENKFSQSKTLFEYGFSHYAYKNLTKANELFKVISPKHASKENSNLDVLYENDINAFITANDLTTDFTPTVTLDEKIKAPISKGSVVGNIRYEIEGITYQTNLIAGQDIQVNTTLSTIFKILAALFLVYLFAQFISRGNKKKRKKKKSKHSSSKKKYR